MVVLFLRSMWPSILSLNKPRARNYDQYGCQRDQKSSVGDQILTTGRPWATHAFFRQPFNLKGKQLCR